MVTLPRRAYLARLLEPSLCLYVRRHQRDDFLVERVEDKRIGRLHEDVRLKVLPRQAGDTT